MKWILPKLEIRSPLSKGIKQFIIKGYAATAGNVYPYIKESTKDKQPIRAFHEYFTKEAIENIARKAKAESSAMNAVI